jgi:hypothetical protein
MRIIFIAAFAIFAIYCGLVLAMRSMGTELPDPVRLLPYAWRPY